MVSKWLWFKGLDFKISGQDTQHVETGIQAPDQDFTSLFTTVTQNSVGDSVPSFHYSYGKDCGPKYWCDLCPSL